MSIRPRSCTGSRLFDGGLLLLVAGLGLLFGVGRNEVRKFENAAAKEIGSKLDGPHKRVSVKAELNGPLDGPFGVLKSATIRASDFSADGLPLFTEPERSTKGSIQSLLLELRNFRLCGLRVEALDAEIPDCRFDYGLAVSKKQIVLSRSGVGTGSVRILEHDLEAFVLRKFREIKRVSIKIDRNRVWVEGFGEFLVVQTEFSVMAKLEAREGNKLFLTDALVFFGDAKADEFSRKAVLDSLNPVVDLDKDLKLFGAVELEGVRLEKGVLEAWGKTRIPEREADQLAGL